MKLNEISTDRALDILCDLTVPITTIAEDKELMKAMLERTTVDNEISKDERKVLGLMQVAKNAKVLVPKLLKEHRQEVYEILSIVNEKDIEEIRSQSPIMTISQIKELLQDEELTSFFSSQVNSKVKQSSTSMSSTEVAE